MKKSTKAIARVIAKNDFIKELKNNDLYSLSSYNDIQIKNYSISKFTLFVPMMKEKTFYYIDFYNRVMEKIEADKTLKMRKMQTEAIEINKNYVNNRTHNLNRSNKNFICDTHLIDSIDFIEHNANNTFTVYFKIKKRVNNID